MQKIKESRVVIPFTGLLHQIEPPTPEPPKQTTPLLTFAVLLFVGGLAIGAVSVHQSADFVQIEHLKTQGKQLLEAQKIICHQQ